MPRDYLPELELLAGENYRIDFGRTFRLQITTSTAPPDLNHPLGLLLATSQLCTRTDRHIIGSINIYNLYTIAAVTSAAIVNASVFQ
jgi:hypothetical protein